MSEMNGNGAYAPQDPAMNVVDPDDVTNALLQAILQCAQKASSSQDTREAAEAMKAALAGAQAVVVLDPGLSVNGTPLEHELLMEQTRQDGMLALEQARAAAAKPSPAKTSGVEGKSP